VPMEAHSKERGPTTDAQDGIAKILELGPSKAEKTPPDQGSNTEYTDQQLFSLSIYVLYICFFVTHKDITYSGQSYCVGFLFI